MSIDLSSATWRKSSRSNGQANCVEVAEMAGGHHAVRDSKDPAGPTLAFPRTQWATFTISVRTGKLG
ncbi:MAG: DUF397 domain-containing protein [Pseudonocardiaceae bacterium]